jgi:hypothetical protein
MRKAKRVAVSEPLRLHPNSWSSLDVLVLDCSESGFRARCEAKVTVGLHVTLDMPGIGSCTATVSWSRDGQFGARFLEPIDLARVPLRPLGAEARLARLLVQRSDARNSVLLEQEARLRRRIAQSLPMIRSGGRSASSAR